MLTYLQYLVDGHVAAHISIVLCSPGALQTPIYFLYDNKNKQLKTLEGSDIYFYKISIILSVQFYTETGFSWEPFNKR